MTTEAGTTLAMPRDDDEMPEVGPIVYLTRITRPNALCSCEYNECDSGDCDCDGDDGCCNADVG